MTDSNYDYPLDPSWSAADIIVVTRLFNAIETAYETSKGVDRDALMSAYRDFKTVVPAKFEEKNLDREFQTASGYSIYRTMQAAKNSERASIKMS